MDETIRVPPHFVDVDGRNVLTAAEAYGLEGVITKRLTSSGSSPAARWYRVVRGENTIDWLAIADVETLLRHAGVDMGGLRAVEPVT